ncbi:hypothetical protein AJ79_07664 [Helicocarpus griseus UAMH5409]|uniref:Uncharacterized protein n=1 Tax=Helicocarpus griseus UAMH5409 TaxID=1447875 RepID=A0A2B7X054_9EURO|nr:hypothetical protein AJ79_07664 [Helicocarpus griseus UAMH5409]
MIARLKNAIKPPKARNPSALIITSQQDSNFNVLHLVPEDGTIERWGFTNGSPITTFHFGGAREEAREQVGEATIDIGDRKGLDSFFEDVETRVGKLWSDVANLSPTKAQAGSDEAIEQLVQDVLRPAALDAIRKREEGLRDRSTDATPTCPVFVLRITRPKAGVVASDKLTSYPV